LINRHPPDASPQYRAYVAKLVWAWTIPWIDQLGDLGNKRQPLVVSAHR
ncbi:MAG: hypothetical protein IM542_07495, partial [Pseudanabaena sp. M165S2SP1A06QC]|nr:hypothetical protein [Pseudanabaena sp. M165S2SP1A06QC]